MSKGTLVVQHLRLGGPEAHIFIICAVGSFCKQSFMSINPITRVAVLLAVCLAASCLYIPEVQMCASTPFLNRQISQYGPTIEKLIDNANISDISYDDKFEGIGVKFNLTEIKPTFRINWNANIIKIEDEHSFTLLSKNVDINMTAHIEFKIAGAIKQKGTLAITIEKGEADITLKFTQPHCAGVNAGKGLGFDVQVSKLYLNTEKLVIKIEGKGVDNLIIRAVMNVLQSRLPAIIEKVALEKVNPAISSLTCSPVNELIGVGEQSYIVVINTTNVPHFIEQDLYAPIDITFVNAVTNSTNDEVENDNLPESNLFTDKAEVSVLASSNLLNSVMWLIDDSNVLKNLKITNDMLGPNPPIELNTLALSILMPGLKKWEKKEVILLVSTSSKFSHLYVRNGKIVSGIGLSIKFVVNVTGQAGEQPVQCIAGNRCVVAVDLNVTLPFSGAMLIKGGNLLEGLLHTLSIEDIKTTSAEIPLNTATLKQILNTMVGSFRPQINKMLQAGIPLDISQLEKYEIKEILMTPKKDYAAVGLIFNQQLSEQ